MLIKRSSTLQGSNHNVLSNKRSVCLMPNVEINLSALTVMDTDDIS